MKSYKNNAVSVDADHLVWLIHWARRYADGRYTWVPRDFNDIYDTIMGKYPSLKQREFRDELLTNRGQYFPHAKAGEYDADYGPIQSVCY